MHQYRKDFEFLFEEYNILRTTIYKVSSHFQKLQDEVNRYNANSKEYAVSSLLLNIPKNIPYKNRY